jgi:hypothetical protein
MAMGLTADTKFYLTCGDNKAGGYLSTTDKSDSFVYFDGPQYVDLDVIVHELSELETLQLIVDVVGWKAALSGIENSSLKHVIGDNHLVFKIGAKIPSHWMSPHGCGSLIDPLPFTVVKCAIELELHEPLLNI